MGDGLPTTLPPGSASGRAADLTGTHAVGLPGQVQPPPRPDLGAAAAGLEQSTPAATADAPLPGSGALTPPPHPAPPTASAQLGTATGGVSGTTTVSGPHGSVTASGAARGTVTTGAVGATGGTDTDGTATIRSVTGSAVTGSGYLGGQVSATTAPGGTRVPGVPTATVDAAAAVKVEASLLTGTIANPDRTNPETVLPAGGQVTTTGAKLGGEAGVSLDARVSVPLGGAQTSPSIDVYGGLRAGVTGSVSDTAPPSFTPRAGSTLGAELVVPLDRNGLDLRVGYKDERDFLSGTDDRTGYVKVELHPHPDPPSTAPTGGGTVMDVVPADLDRLVTMHAQRADAFTAAGGRLGEWPVPGAEVSGHPLATQALTRYLAEHAAALHGHARRDADTGACVGSARTTYRLADATAAGELNDLLEGRA